MRQKNVNLKISKILAPLTPKIIAIIAVGIVTISVIAFFVVQAGNNNPANKNSDTSSSEQKINETGYIYIEAGDGVLSGTEGGQSYIAESARGREAYLAEKGATATYNFNTDKPGNYRLEISLTDDGVWDDGSRNATVTVNDGGIVFYKHRSEDTKGWKWYSVGVVSIKDSTNKITFVKDEDTYAAFVMDQFRLIPVF